MDTEEKPFSRDTLNVLWNNKQQNNNNDNNNNNNNNNNKRVLRCHIASKMNAVEYLIYHNYWLDSPELTV